MSADCHDPVAPHAPGSDARRPRTAKQPRLTPDRASEISRLYWTGLSAEARRLRLLRGQVAIGDAARRELAKLTVQQQLSGEDAGGAPCG